MDGYALRVPTPTVSVIDLTVELETSTTTEELRQAFRDAAAGPLKGILQAVDEPLVSIDYKGDPHSSSVDLPFTMVLGKEKNNFAKIVAWYDNEWGYSVRTADLAALIGKILINMITGCGWLYTAIRILYYMEGKCSIRNPLLILTLMENEYWCEWIITSRLKIIKW